MRSLLTLLVRKLTAWAWRLEIDTCESIAKINELHATENGIELSIKQDPAQAQYVAQCFAHMVAASENYTEMRFEIVAKGSKWEWLTVLIKKGNGKTPHQLRQQAEQERDALQRIIDDMLEAQYGGS